MKMKKVLKHFLVVCSILIGVTPLLMKSNLFKKRKNESPSKLSPQTLAGDWLTEDEKFRLNIYPQASLSVNGTKLNLKLHSIHENELFLQDPYGYGITVKQIDEQSLELFDEAEDEKYIFYREVL